MNSPDIRDACTPLSLGNHAPQGPRALWKHPLLRSTSTPNPKYALDFLQPRHFRLDLERSSSEERSYLDISESPILPAQPKVNSMAIPIFGRRRSVQSDNLSATAVVSTMGKMELCENNNNISSSEDFNSVKDNKLDNLKGEGSSHFHASNELRKIKNKKRKSNSPKNKSPKMLKAGLIKRATNSDGVRKKIANSSKPMSATATTSNVKKQKSPKNKSPKTFKICAKKVINLNSSQKKIKSVKKEKLVAGTSKNAPSSSSQPDSQCSKLKTSRLARSPKLRTAERARIYQQIEEARKEKEKFMEEERRRALELQKLHEEEEIKKIRQQTMFKANSVRRYAPLPQVKRRALTDPVSPNLCKRRRIEYSAQSCNSQNSHRTQ